MLDSTSVFKNAKEVVANDELTRDQKIETLRCWEYDARELEEAEEEARMAVLRPKMFCLIVEALRTRCRTRYGTYSAEELAGSQSEF